MKKPKRIDFHTLQKAREIDRLLFELHESLRIDYNPEEGLSELCVFRNVISSIRERYEDLELILHEKGIMT